MRTPKTRDEIIATEYARLARKFDFDTGFSQLPLRDELSNVTRAINECREHLVRAQSRYDESVRSLVATCLDRNASLVDVKERTEALRSSAWSKAALASVAHATLPVLESRRTELAPLAEKERADKEAELRTAAEMNVAAREARRASAADAK